MDHQGNDTNDQEENTSETAPLLNEGGENPAEPILSSPPNPTVQAAPDSTLEGPPPAYSEAPPPYSSGPPPGVLGEPTVACRVCHQLIFIRGRENQRVVKCASCHEATPIKPPPHGKKYIRCPCNALLTCRSTSTRISCPRTNCKRIINVGGGPPSASAPVPQVQNTDSRIRVTCGHCNETFVIWEFGSLQRYKLEDEKIFIVYGDGISAQYLFHLSTQPIKPPPHGKKYIRCPCNALLTCRSTSTRISCPRTNCKRIINVGGGPPSASAPVPQVQNTDSRIRVTCGHCNETFVFRITAHLARCPYCRKVSSVGGKFAMSRAIIFAAIGLIFLIAGVVVTVSD
eukprot:gene1257-15638_t